MIGSGRFSRMREGFKARAVILGACLAAMWFVALVDLIFIDESLAWWGIRPRTLLGLAAIPIAPLLHDGTAHLAANTLPFFVLGWLVMLRRTRDFFAVSAIVAAVSGLGIWLSGPAGTTHCGASGLILGYFGFLVLRGYLDRSALAVAIALVVVFFYGGLLWGLLPTAGVSWLGHIFGVLGGAGAAAVLARGRSKPEG
jgi:membrane associated rhomboid family serine protease